MKPIQLFLAVGACLSLAIPALAISEPDNLERMEREIQAHAQDVEARVHHLNEAAQHLAEADLNDQADVLRGKAKALHQELHNKIKHIERLREEQIQRAKEAANLQREQAEAKREAELATEHAKGVAENWDRIRDAAGGKRPQQDKPKTDKPHRPQPTDRAVPQERQVRPNPSQQAYDRQSRILYEILRTLQDMNSKLDAMHEEHGEDHDDDDHHGDHDDDDDDHEDEEEEHDDHHHRESEEEHKRHGHGERRG